MADELGQDVGEGKVIRSSDKALLIRFETGDEKWVPRSQIHDDSEVYEEGHEGIVIVSRWLAKKLELI